MLLPRWLPKVTVHMAAVLVAVSMGVDSLARVALPEGLAVARVVLADSLAATMTEQQAARPAAALLSTQVAVPAVSFAAKAGQWEFIASGVSIAAGT